MLAVRHLVKILARRGGEWREYDTLNNVLKNIWARTQHIRLLLSSFCYGNLANFFLLQHSFIHRSTSHFSRKCDIFGTKNLFTFLYDLFLSHLSSAPTFLVNVMNVGHRCFASRREEKLSR